MKSFLRANKNERSEVGDVADKESVDEEAHESGWEWAMAAGDRKQQVRGGFHAVVDALNSGGGGEVMRESETHVLV